MIYWEDIRPGRQFESGSIGVAKADILEFADQFDPQPFHLVEAAGDSSIFGGLCASGWHVCALTMRLLTDAFDEQRIAAIDSPAVPALRWHKPVFAGDTLSALIRVDACAPAVDPKLGLVQCSIEVRNQHGRPVMKSKNDLLVARRPPGAAGD